MFHNDLRNNKNPNVVTQRTILNGRHSTINKFSVSFILLLDIVEFKINKSNTNCYQPHGDDFPSKKKA